jgi:predicted RNA binding protein YcfA (HicA-like mRNA interferase family)
MMSGAPIRVKSRIMPRHRTTLERILAGASDPSIRFVQLEQLLVRLGFIVRVSGSHHKFSRYDIPEIVVLQPARDGNAKGYQVKQVRRILREYGFGEIEHD